MSSLLVGLLLAMPASSLAATPNWMVESTAKLPGTVKLNSAAGFSATVFNPGPGNISQFSMSAWLQQPFVGAPANEVRVPPAGYSQTPVYAALLLNGNEVPNACPAPWGAPVVCGLSALGKNQRATLIVAYQTSGMAAAGIHAWAESSGGGSTFCTGGDNSHGDCLPIHVGPTTISNSTDFGGGWVQALAPVTNGAVNGSSNPQSTKVTPPAVNIPVTVADGTAVVGDPGCPAQFAPCSLEAGTAQLLVGDGTDRYGLFQVVIEYDKSILKGVNFKKLSIIHVFDDGSPPVEITVQNSCDGTMQCGMLDSLRGGGGRVTIWLERNGFIKYH